MKNASLGLGNASLLLCLGTESAFAFGKKPAPAPTTPPAPVGIQAKPYRYVNLAHVTVPAFYLPNGMRADFNTDLDAILGTAINSSRYLRTQENTESAKSRLIITGGITNLELDVMQLNIKIGWNKGGAIPIGTIGGVQGEVDLKLSTLSMDFKIYDRYSGKVYSASYTNESLSNLHMTVKVNLSEITGSLDLLYKTKLAETIRKATLDIMTNIENSQNFMLIPWEAKILGIDQNRNSIIFDAGMSAGIRVNEVYSIYSGCTEQEQNTPNACYERFLADVRVSNTNPINSEAVPFTQADSISKVWAGDKIYIKPLISTQNSSLRQ